MDDDGEREPFGGGEASRVGGDVAVPEVQHLALARLADRDTRGKDVLRGDACGGVDGPAWSEIRRRQVAAGGADPCGDGRSRKAELGHDHRKGLARLDAA